jgi:hypothetical protein
VHWLRNGRDRNICRRDDEPARDKHGAGEKIMDQVVV